MSKKMIQKLNRYYHNIGRALACGRRKKRIIIANIKDSIACYLDEHPDATMDDIYENFGVEKDIADEFFNNENAEAIKERINRSRVIMLSIVIAIILALLIYIVAIVTAVIADVKSTNGYGEIYFSEVPVSNTVVEDDPT